MPASENIVTVPNILCVLRLLAAPALIVLAWYDLPDWCLASAIVLLLIDWLDGKLARLLKQETVFGARLDSVADFVLYACILAAVILLRGEVLRQEWIWIAVALASYAVNVTAGLVKFHRLPAYHTRLAKTSWFLMVVAVLFVFGGWSAWPLRIAMVGVTVTNLEATALTALLPEWRANVPSLWHALPHKMKRSDSPTPVAAPHRENQ